MPRWASPEEPTPRVNAQPNRVPQRRASVLERRPVVADAGRSAPPGRRLDDDQVDPDRERRQRATVGQLPRSMSVATARQVRRACAWSNVSSGRPKSRLPRQRTSTTTRAAGGPGSMATRSSSSRPTPDVGGEDRPADGLEMAGDRPRPRPRPVAVASGAGHDRIVARTGLHRRLSRGQSSSAVVDRDRPASQRPSAPPRRTRRRSGGGSASCRAPAGRPDARARRSPCCGRGRSPG